MGQAQKNGLPLTCELKFPKFLTEWEALLGLSTGWDHFVMFLDKTRHLTLTVPLSNRTINR